MHKKLNIILIILLIITVGFVYIWCAPSTGQIGALTDFLHDLAMNNHAVYEVATIQFNGVYAIGNSGSTETVDWQNGQYQSITIDEACVISFSNPFVGTITLIVTWSATAAMTFNGDYTILEEGGVEYVPSDTDGLVDYLKIVYLGTEDEYTVGALIDVKD